ncbi:MAG: putative sulfate exporter family transporter [Verrucomicrobiales bacterium]|nr:putative sulfate exporter family transporter [Verrucomicrobiales bacterium]
MATGKQRQYNVYLASEAVSSIDSFEGVPDYTDQPRSDESQLTYRWQKQLHKRLDAAGDLAPGLFLAGIVATLATFTANWLGTDLLGYSKSPVSPILVTVIFGLVLRNTIGLPVRYRDGLNWCVKRALRVGVALLGLGLSLTAVGTIGLTALPIVFGCIITAIFGVIWFGKLIGLTGNLSTLIAVGTSICGVSAIVATGPAIRADDDEISYGVTVITLFGILALATYPFLSHSLFQGDPVMAGLFLGTAIHDTSQVAGAGLMYEMTYLSPEAMNVATTTKLLRNLCLGIVVPVLSILYRKKNGNPATPTRFRISKFIPGFVIAFVGLAVIRSVGDIGDRPFLVLTPEIWSTLLGYSKALSLVCLTLALSAIGLGTSFSQIRELGLRPLAVGFASAALVGVVSYCLIRLFASP